MLRCMRTTLSLDDDVAALLRRAHKVRKGSLKAVVNDALRQGLKDLLAPPRATQSFHTPIVSLGRLPCRERG
jgi:hypothetical protein